MLTREKKKKIHPASIRILETTSSVNKTLDLFKFFAQDDYLDVRKLRRLMPVGSVKKLTSPS